MGSGTDAGKPIFLKGKAGSDYYSAAKITVTGDVRGDLEGCRYWYEQNEHRHWQEVPCQTTIRLGDPLPEDN